MNPVDGLIFLILAIHNGYAIAKCDANMKHTHKIIIKTNKNKCKIMTRIVMKTITKAIS